MNLHRCAVEVAEHHDGALPDDLDLLLALPGIGPYTARAVLAFAFEQPVGVVDTNVGRVLARWEARSLQPAEAQSLADSLVPADQAWLWNQSIMELGGTVCRRRTPECAACPAFADCGWQALDLSAPDPADRSAGVSKGQSRFDGSDRQGRGRLVDALRSGPVAASDLPEIMGWPDDPARAHRVAATVVADGLATHHDSTYRLA